MSEAIGFSQFGAVARPPRRPMEVSRRARTAAAMTHGLAIATLGCALGFLAATPGPAVSQERGTRPPPVSADGAPSGTASSAAVSRVRALLDAGMPVTASRTLARELSLGVLEGFESVILAARAYAEQRSWGAVRRLIVGRDWTDEALESEALFLLARAYVGLDSASRAVETYEAYLSGGPEPVPAAVRVDLARALSATGRDAEAADQFGRLADERPGISRWADLSRLHALAGAGDTAAYALAETLAETPLVPADSAWRIAAELAFRVDDPERGVEYARRADRAVWRSLAEDRIAPYLFSIGDSAGALDALRAALERGSTELATGETLLAADRSWRTLRDVSRSDVRSGRPSRAANYLRSALELAPESEQAGLAEALAGAYRALGNHERAIQAIGPWLGGREAPPERLASMWLLAARSFAALGESEASAEAYEKAASGSGNAASQAAYLIADSHHDAGRLDEARAAYERSAERFPSSSFGSRSLERLALLDYREGRYAEARTLLVRYRNRYPRGGWVQGAIYWTGRTLEAEGDTAAASARYAEAIEYDPLDYYAILAGDRLGRDRWESVRLREAEPLPPLAESHASALERMNLLRELGWVERARIEYRAARERGPADWSSVLAWARALNAAGWTQEGVSEGWRAKSKWSGWSRPLLEAIYPLPFGDALAHAARERGLDAHLVAGLSRRESLFDPEIRSSANAIGLMQLLPTTARDVARRAGLPEYDRSQLTVPQVNLLLGTRYLADVLGRFDDQPIAGMISYNAGPHRYVRWREFPEFDDPETAVERIPFRETREYVRAVSELAEIYRFLYPDLGSTIP